MTARVEGKRLTVKVDSALLVQQNGEIGAGRLHSLASDLLSIRRHGQAVILATSDAMAPGRRRSAVEEWQAAAVGQIASARHERAWKDETIPLDRCDAHDLRHLNALTTVLDAAIARPARVLPGAARSVIEATLREATALAGDLLSICRRGQRVIVATFDAIAFGRRLLGLEGKKAAATGQFIPASHKRAESDGTFCLDTGDARDPGRVSALTSVLGPVTGLPARLPSGAARTVIETVLREAAALVRVTRVREAAEALPS